MEQRSRHDEDTEHIPQYSFSRMNNSDISTADFRPTGSSFVSLALLPGIDPIIPAEAPPVERPKDYKGRRRVWPGVLGALLLMGTAVALICCFALRTYNNRQATIAEWEQNNYKSTKIHGGAQESPNGDLISDDGQVGNPKEYPASKCELPNYLSKGGQIVAVSANGTEVPIKIKGINWFGMETGVSIPFGMWTNSENGTTAYQIATFLEENKFNAIRLPLMIASILSNKGPDPSLINRYENRAVNVTTYMSLLKSVVKVLQFRHIGVLLSMHTLTKSDNGKLWYDSDISEDDFLKSVDVLTSNLCSREYYNVIGIDVKNEPWGSTWGDGGKTDFLAGAERIGNRMLKGCKKWLGFVEGINAMHSITINGTKFSYYDWYGGGLQDARTKGVTFSIDSKLVYAPHYYTPAVYPQAYLYGGGTVSPTGIANYVELDDATLRHRIKATMDDMFGFLVSDTGPAVLLGEFGGLYATDKHPLKTTQRCTDFTMDIIKSDNYAGGFVWSLNPESAYQYNPVDTMGTFTEGVLQDDWLSANKEYLKGLTSLDPLNNLKAWPCFIAHS